MSALMECELKLGLVRAEDLERLLAALPEPQARIEQHNHYFIDAAGRLAESRTMVRVRVATRSDTPEAPLIVLTRKRRLEAKAGYFIAEELECPLSEEAWSRVEAGEIDLLDLDLEPLKTLELSPPLFAHGLMHNLRQVVESGGYTLEIDRTTFPGPEIQVEIEVETDDPEGARAHILSITEAKDIALFNQTRGKYARFLEALRR